MRNLLVVVLLAALAAVTLSAVMTGKHAVAVRGQLMCGSVPAENVKVRLFRVKQPKKDGTAPLFVSYTLQGRRITTYFDGFAGELAAIGLCRN